MRTFILTIATVFGLLMLPATAIGTVASTDLSIGNAVSLDAHSLQDAPKPPQINVEINKGGGGRAWYQNPVWIAIGALAFVLLVVLIVMAAKGGGTTVLKT